MKNKKLITAIFLTMSLIFTFPLSASALTVPTLYADVTGGTQVDNLVNYACKYDTFNNCRYIVFRDSANSYYIAWGDKDAFTVSDYEVNCSDCSYVRYSRESTTSAWEYLYIENDTLVVGCDKLCVSNLPGVVGFISDTADNWQYRHDIRQLVIVSGVIFIFIGLVLAVRRT